MGSRYRKQQKTSRNRNRSLCEQSNSLPVVLITNLGYFPHIKYRKNEEYSREEIDAMIQFHTKPKSKETPPHYDQFRCWEPNCLRLDVRFHNSSEQLEHMKCVHENRIVVFKCKFCCQHFPTKGGLKSHHQDTTHNV